MLQEIREFIMCLGEQKRRESYLKKHHPRYLNIIKNWGENRWANFTQLLYHFYHGLYEIPLCRCSRPVKFRSFTTGYNKYCSVLCASTDTSNFEKKVKKARATCLRKYGVDNPSKLDDIKEKIRKTSLLKYGVDNFTKTKEYSEKVKMTNMTKWGMEWFMSTRDFKDKTMSTNLEKYGTRHHTQNEEFKKRQKENDYKKWSKSEKSQHYRTKRQDYINSKKFTESLETQKQNNKVKFQNYYQNYNDSVELINISDSMLSFKCKKCHLEFDISKQLLYLRTRHQHDVCTFCNPKNSKNYSQMERVVKDFIESIYKGDILQNYKIGKQEIDIFIPALSIGFDFNGLFWHSEKYKNSDYHLSKKLFFKERNIKLIYIWENDWIEKNDIIKSMITAKLGCINEKIMARDCVLSVIKDERQIKDFFQETHLDGYLGSGTSIALSFNDRVVMLVTFEMTTEGCKLSQFSSQKNIIVVGGLSKIIKHFIKISDVKMFYSNSDYARFDGDIYQKLNFRINSVSQPEYFWAKNKKKLNADVTGAFKVWNCGYQKWIFTA